MKFGNIRILGTDWCIEKHSSKDDKNLETCDAYTDWTVRKIIIQDMNEITFTLYNPQAYMRKVMRHEIIHAYLFESGLAYNTAKTDAWAYNEEMVDWFAYMFTNILDTFKQVECI